MTSGVNTMYIYFLILKTFQGEVITSLSTLFSGYGIYKSLCNCNLFYIKKIGKSFEIQYDKRVFEMKCEKYSPKLYSARRVLEHNHKVYFSILKNI